MTEVVQQPRRAQPVALWFLAAQILGGAIAVVLVRVLLPAKHAL